LLVLLLMLMLLLLLLTHLKILLLSVSLCEHLFVRSTKRCWDLRVTIVAAVGVVSMLLLLMLMLSRGRWTNPVAVVIHVMTVAVGTHPVNSLMVSWSVGRSMHSQVNEISYLYSSPPVVMSSDKRGVMT
jgi:hypothetical protein